MSIQKADGSLGERLDYTVYSVLTLRELGYRYNNPKTVEFIRNCQLPDGGFSFRMGDQATANIYSTYLAVKGLYAIM